MDWSNTGCHQFPACSSSWHTSSDMKKTNQILGLSVSLPHSKYHAKTRRETEHNFGRLMLHIILFTVYNN